jgi:adenylate kinase family enzyme
MQLFIIGNSGAGKSTLAARVAAETGRRSVDLDPFAFTEEMGVRRPLAESVEAVRAEMGDASCVVEGVYADLVAGVMTREDQLIWLDMSLETCREHCMSRPWEPHKWPSKEAQDAHLEFLLGWIAEYERGEGPMRRPAHAELFAAHPGPKLRLDSPEQVAGLSLASWAVS